MIRGLAMRRNFTLVALLLPFLVVLTAGSIFAQVGADRVAMTGLVSDPSGAAVPNAKVTLTNEDTGVSTVISTNTAGNFTSPALILGNYTLKVEKEGFKTYTHTNMALTIGGRTFTQDVTLQLGSVTQTVEVKANVQLINTQSPTVSYQVGKQYYQDLPEVMGADVRLAEAKLVLSPGYVPTAPNGDAIFRGDAFASRINGGQTVSWESWFDGAEYGYAEGHQQTHESSIPYSAVQEMTTTVNNFSAQYGHTSGGIALYTTKSGTNKLHGELYDFLTSNKLDANNFFLNASHINTLPLTQNNPGFALGGPIPKIHKWGKTFWFTNYDRLDYHSTVNTGYQNTLPTPLERGGDFSQLLSSPNAGCGAPPCQIGTDALGRPIYYGEIFNPATTRTVGGIPVRDGYGFDPTTGLPIPGQANMIPANDPLMSGNAGGQVVAGLIPALDRNTLFSPNEFGGTSDDNDKINVWTWLFRVDHTFNDKWSLSFTYFQNHRPRTAHCGGPQGCNTTHGGADSAQNTSYIGQGFYQIITNHFAHLQLNWVIKPNMFNHATLAYDRWNMNGHQLSSGVGWNQKLGLGLPNQPAFNNAGFPSINFSGNNVVNYTAYGTPWYPDGADINNRYQFYDDLTWITGKHTVKVGIQSMYLQFPQTGWAVNTGGNFHFSANETAAYDSTGTNLSGQTGDAFAAFLLGQVDNANFTVPQNYMPEFYYVAPWINDSYKVTPHLTLELGLRLDWNSGLSEQYGRFSTMNPTLANPGAGGYPGAMVFGSAAYGNGSTGVAPRFGFAYQLGKNNVIRGGLAEYYGATIAGSWAGNPYPTNGFLTNPSANNVTGGEFPAYYFGGGFPQGSITFPPNTSPSVENGASPIGVLPDSYEMPRWINWTVSYQHQWGGNMSLDVAYVGNHGTRLPINSYALGQLANENAGSVLSLGPALTNGAFVNGVPNAAAIAAGYTTPPYAGFTGDLAQALRPWPQYQHMAWREGHIGKSYYNSLQLQFNKRYRNNSLTVSYTYSRLMNNGAESGEAQQGADIQNPSNRMDIWGPSQDDVPQLLTIGEVYTLPFGSGETFLSHSTGVLEKLIGHWSISSILSYESGRPQVMYVANNLGSYLFAEGIQFPNVVSGQNPVNSASFTDPFSQRYYNAAAFTAPGAFAFGNAPRTATNRRGFPYYNEDLSLYKDTYFGEEKYVRFKASAGNVFNRVDFCPPDSNISDSNFGQTFTQCNIARRIQFGLQIFF
jgi:Carboxypeptidase regulatory-like domain